MHFRLKKPFEPTGDQPQAIQFLTHSISSGHRYQTLMGVTGSGKTFTLANVIQNLQKPTLVISHNKTLAAQLYQEFRDFFPDNAVSYFVSYYDYYQPESYLPTTDTYIEKETDINDEIDKLRLAATAHLLTRPDVIVVASVSAIYNLGSPLEFAAQNLELIVGEMIDRSVVTERLISMQYAHSDYDLKRGAFLIKGDTLTVWPADQDYCLKLKFFEKSLESITPVDPITRVPLKIQNLNDKSQNRFLIHPAKHYQAEGKVKTEILTEIQHDLALRLSELKKQGKILEAYRLAQRIKYDLDMIREFGYVNGIENYSRYFDGRKPGEPPYSLLEYFHYNVNHFKSQSFLTIIDESHMTVPQIKGMYFGDKSRKQTLIDYGFRLPSALDNRPLTFAEFLKNTQSIIFSSATPSDFELKRSCFQLAEQLLRPTGLLDPTIEIHPSSDQIPHLIKQIKQTVQQGQRVLVTTLTKRTAEALTQHLNQKNPTIKVQYLHADVKLLDRADILDALRDGNYDVVVGINLLREGLDLPEVSLVAILEADKEGFLRSYTSLIQTMGRAARHNQGRVILYADTKTPSMIKAINESKRRRQFQLDYNQKHGLTPKSIAKPIRRKVLNRVDLKTTSPLEKKLSSFGWNSLSDIDPLDLTPKDQKKALKVLRALMLESAKNWDFETAAKYRDLIKSLNHS